MEILYDHYKSCLSDLAGQLKIRLRLLVLVLLVLSVMVLSTLSEGSLLDILIGIEALGLDRDLDVHSQALGSLLWVLLGSLVALMNQKSLLIEEQNRYIRGVESHLDRVLGECWIYRKRLPERPTHLKIGNYLYFVNYLLVLGAGSALVLHGEFAVEWQKASSFGEQLWYAFDAVVFLVFIAGSTILSAFDLGQLSARDPSRSSKTGPGSVSDRSAGA